ncbi:MULTISPECIES: pectate lyase family protein [unclassified Micromonospora]|uniref:pectate lyase family protein n=1 Tax=unclassified Micromonospora TaxID=2617518 RepID=UPI0033BA9C11
MPSRIDCNDLSDGYDRLLDIKRESDFIMVSWNHFHHHSKSALVGHSDNYPADLGKLRVTYHHNFFDGTDQRHPRVRFADLVHVLNNYYRNALYGIASTRTPACWWRGTTSRTWPTRATSVTTRAAPAGWSSATTGTSTRHSADCRHRGRAAHLLPVHGR